MVVKFTLVSSFDFVLVLFTYVVYVSILQQVRIAGSYKWGLSMRKAECCFLVLIRVYSIITQSLVVFNGLIVLII